MLKYLLQIFVGWVSFLENFKTILKLFSRNRAFSIFYNCFIIISALLFVDFIDILHFSSEGTCDKLIYKSGNRYSSTDISMPKYLYFNLYNFTFLLVKNLKRKSQTLTAFQHTQSHQLFISTTSSHSLKSHKSPNHIPDSHYIPHYNPHPIPHTIAFPAGVWSGHFNNFIQFN